MCQLRMRDFRATTTTPLAGGNCGRMLLFIIVKKFKEAGATILGGCCETRPSHIKAMASVR